MVERRKLASHRNHREGSLEEQIIQVNRVAKKRSGGDRVGFSVLVGVGDQRGRVGVALGKAPDVTGAIKKASQRAKRKLISVPLVGGTIPHQLREKFGAAIILLKPAPPGHGLVAGSSVRTILRLAGVKDISAKIMGTRNQVTNAYATIRALKRLKPPRVPAAKPHPEKIKTDPGQEKAKKKDSGKKGSGATKK